MEQFAVACAATGMFRFVRGVRFDLLVRSRQPGYTSGHISPQLFWFGVVRPVVAVRSYIRAAVGLRAPETLLCFVARRTINRRTIARPTSGTFSGFAAGLLPSRLLGLLPFGLLPIGLFTFGLFTFDSRPLGLPCLRLGAPRSLACGDDLWIGCGDSSTSGHARHRRDRA